jgi:oligosaccharyltransferase complex subunit alpha (ribophorin I)
MSKRSRALPLLLLAASTLAYGLSFENTAVVRTVELGGSVAHVTTTFAIRSLEDGLKTYTVALGRDDKAKTSWLEAKVKGQKATLQVKEGGFDADRCVSNLLPTCHQRLTNLEVNAILSISFCQKRCPSIIP